MAIESTLQKVKEDIAAGDLGLARDRLHGLISTYPNRLDLRPRLGEVYWQLQFPAMAGRYWYLAEDRAPDKEEAIGRFESACGEDPRAILHALKFRGDLDSLDDLYAREKLLDLQDQVAEKHGYRLDFKRRGSERYVSTPRLDRERRMVYLGCSLVATLALSLMIMGIISLVTRIF